MKPLTWSETELLQSKASNHDKTERRYSLDNENFDYDSPLEIFWVLEGQKLLEEGAAYFTADFALVEPNASARSRSFSSGWSCVFLRSSKTPITLTSKMLTL